MSTRGDRSQADVPKTALANAESASARDRQARSPDARRFAPRGAALAGLRRRLLRFYDREARDLPWRRTRDPYAIWISEVMLQQTRVETGRERWPRFLGRFPDLPTLARARESSVLKAWEGLGYYRRARNLHKSARSILREHAGQLPRTRAELLALPGFGPYTAAAVASIAFGEAVAVVDGNVQRVLARLSAEPRDVTKAPARRALEELAQRLLAPRRPGDWNQAVMELGATVCTPRRPRCEACPLSRDCVAHHQGDVLAYPVKPRRGPVPHFDIAAGLVWDGGRLLIARRPKEGLLGGLWEFPGGKRREGEALEAACVREVREETGLVVRCEAPFAAIPHAYSHFKITLHLFHCRRTGGRLAPKGCEAPRFVTPAQLERYAFPRANRRAIERLLQEGVPDFATGA